MIMILSSSCSLVIITIINTVKLIQSNMKSCNELSNNLLTIIAKNRNIVKCHENIKL